MIMYIIFHASNPITDIALDESLNCVNASNQVILISDITNIIVSKAKINIHGQLK